MGIPALTGISNGLHLFKLVVTDNLGATSEKETEITVVDPLITSNTDLQANHITLYPNPSVNQITITGIDANKYWEITNTIGVRTLTGKRTSVDISSLPKGIYLIHFGEHDYPFVKQ